MVFARVLYSVGIELTGHVRSLGLYGDQLLALSRTAVGADVSP